MTSQPSNLIVRAARPEDDAAVGDLLVEGYLTAYARKMPHVVVDEQRKRDLRDVASKRATARVLVALDGNGRVVGTVALWPQGADGSEAWLPGFADLRHLATAPDLQGRGLSGPLLDEAERIAREELGAKGICLHVRRGNEGVRRLYERRGFLRDESGDLELPTVSLLAFAKRL